MSTRDPRYTLFEAEGIDGGTRLFLRRSDRDIVELRKVVDQTAGREALILVDRIPYDISKYLHDIWDSDRRVRDVTLTPPPIWDYPSAFGPSLTVIELRKIPNSFADNSLLKLL